MANLEHPKYYLEKVNYSIAHFFEKIMPEVTVYFGGNQQKVQYPCVYITYTGEIEREDQVDTTHEVMLPICLVYEESPDNQVQGIETRYIEVARIIDENIKQLTWVNYDENFEILNEFPINARDTKYKWDATALWYYFNLVFRLRDIEECDKIEKVNYTIEEKE